MLYVYDTFAFLVYSIQNPNSKNLVSLPSNVDLESVMIVDKSTAFSVPFQVKNISPGSWIEKNVMVKFKDQSIQGVLKEQNNDGIMLLSGQNLVKIKDFDTISLLGHTAQNLPLEKLIEIEFLSKDCVVHYAISNWSWKCVYHFYKVKDEILAHSKIFISNLTNMAYNGEISLLAGNVKRVNSRNNVSMKSMQSMNSFQNESFSDSENFAKAEKMDQYQEFQLSGTHDIPIGTRHYNKPLLEPFQLKYEVIFNYQVNSHNEKSPLEQILQMVNNQKIALPAGVVNIYESAFQFLGSSHIGIVKPGEKFQIKLGESVFIHGKHKFFEKNERDDSIFNTKKNHVEFLVELENKDTENSLVHVRWQVGSYPHKVTQIKFNDSVQSSSFPHFKEGSQLIFPVTIKPNQKITLQANFTIF